MKTGRAEQEPQEQARRDALLAAVKGVNESRRKQKQEDNEYLRAGGILKEISDASAGKGRAGDTVEWKLSPLGNMARWRDSSCRVAVVIRSVGKANLAVRGKITGRLQAFDKHFNLVLSDALEQLESQLPGQLVRQRRLRQLFVRGDSVVSVQVPFDVAKHREPPRIVEASLRAYTQQTRNTLHRFSLHAGPAAVLQQYQRLVQQEYEQTQK